MKSDQSDRKSVTLGPIIVGIGLVFAVLLLPFLPLLLALAEMAIFQTGHVEDLCREIGIHDELSKLYRFVFDMF